MAGLPDSETAVRDSGSRLSVDSGEANAGIDLDDHEVVRKGVRSLLLQAGYGVCGEGIDGEDGLAKAKELRPDVIVMDVSMPPLNRLEASRRVRGILPDIQVVMLSQHESPEMVRLAVSSGARAYVTKSSIGKPAGSD